MKKALVSTIEDVSYSDGQSGKRIAQVVNTGEEFEVHEVLIWIDCTDEVAAETHFYSNGEIKLIPTLQVDESPT
jgi:hypothetical protein